MCIYFRLRNVLWTPWTNLMENLKGNTIRWTKWLKRNKISWLTITSYLINQFLHYWHAQEWHVTGQTPEVWLPINLSTSISVHLLTYPFTNLHTYFGGEIEPPLSISLFIPSTLIPSILPSFRPFCHPFSFLPTYLSDAPTCLPTFQPTYLPFYPTLWLSLPIHLPTKLPFCPHTCIHMHTCTPTMNGCMDTECHKWVSE